MLNKGAIAAVGIAAGALGAALIFASYDPTQTRAMETIRRDLVDPGSAQFDDLKTIDSPLGALVCGRVNSKNRMGGYDGASLFSYSEINRTACLAKDYRGIFVCGSYLKHCFPAMRIPANAGEAHKWDMFGQPL